MTYVYPFYASLSIRRNPKDAQMPPNDFGSDTKSMGLPQGLVTRPAAS